MMTFMFKILNMHENIILLPSHIFMNGKKIQYTTYFPLSIQRKHHQLNITSNISFHKIVWTCVFFYYFNFMLIVIIIYKASFDNKWQVDWLKMQVTHVCFVYSFPFVFWNLELSNVLNVLFITSMEDLSCFSFIFT